jgi:hypothetical protein
MQIISERVYASVDFAGPSARIVRPSKQVLRGEIDIQTLSRTQREQMRNNLFTDLLPVRDLKLESRNAILDEQHEFIQCIRTRRPPRLSGEEGRKCLAVAERILGCIGPPQHRRRVPRILAAPLPLAAPATSEERKAG